MKCLDIIDKKWISSPAPWMIDLCILETMDKGHNKGIEMNMDVSALAFISEITRHSKSSSNEIRHLSPSKMKSFLQNEGY